MVESVRWVNPFSKITERANAAKERDSGLKGGEHFESECVCAGERPRGRREVCNLESELF